jgi:hypothetical protein
MSLRLLREMMALASAGIFSRRYPDHPITAQLLQPVDEAVVP